MSYSTISVSICLVMLSVCHADKTEQAFSSISYHRHDVPLSYNFSQIHIYSTKSPQTYAPVKNPIIQSKYQKEQYSNIVDDENEYGSNPNEVKIPKTIEYDSNRKKQATPENDNNLSSQNEENFYNSDYTVVNHQAQIETHVKEKPQGFINYPQTQESTPVNDNVYFHGLPIQFYLNRAVKANLELKTPEEGINTNNLVHHSENKHHVQNVIRYQNVPQPFQHQLLYTIPAVQLNEAHAHSIASVPNKALTQIYNVERPQYQEPHGTQT